MASTAVMTSISLINGTTYSGSCPNHICITKGASIISGSDKRRIKKNDNFTFLIQIRALDDEVINRIEQIYPIYQSNKDVNIAIENQLHQED